MLQSGITKESLLDHLLQPSQALIEDISIIEGDILLLGAGGKMGPAMAKLAARAVSEADVRKDIIAVSRFSEPGVAAALNDAGVKTVALDILDDAALHQLPNVKNVIYLAGQKFGTQGNESYTWAMNVYLPGRVADKFKHSNIVAFSSGNVYPFSPVGNGGLAEDRSAAPVGEYAQSCLGRERIFQYFSKKNGTPLLLYRLNYANDVSYGVLLELAKAVYENKEIDLSMGNVNVIWQGDANEIAIRSLLYCQSPARILNVTGPETISVKWLANEFAKLFNKQPRFINAEQPDALLNNAAECFRLFGYPRVTLKQMILLIAQWVADGGKTANKETHFQQRDGNY